VFGDVFFAGNTSSEEDKDAEPSTCKCIKENEKKKGREQQLRRRIISGEN
jgi:hypothetical protein